jgi:hypothetical protein
MTPVRALAIAAVASTVAFALPVAATAAPHHYAAARASAAKPTGTIFFTRNGSGPSRSMSMKASGASLRRLPGAAAFLLPVPSKHEIVYSTRTSSGSPRLDVASYAGKVKHSYKVPHLGTALSVSPNGKDVGTDSLNGSSTREVFRVRTLAGKVVATLFTLPAGKDQVWESWNAAGSQLAVMVRNISAETASLAIYSRHGTLIRTIIKNQANVAYLSWSKTGTIAIGRLNQILVVPSTGGTPSILFAETSVDPGNAGIAYSPNGKFLAYGSTSVKGGAEKIWVANANGTDRHVINRNGRVPTWG